MTKFILCDIEGTTTSISFVHDTLFPYFIEKFPDFWKKFSKDEKVQAGIQAMQDYYQVEEGLQLEPESAAEKFIEWAKQDRKHAILKDMQGYVWRQGYESGTLKGHVYEDVPPNLLKWQTQGIKIGIYSSGSVEAQKLLFGASIYGNLNPRFSFNFDTQVGAKRAAESYQKISEETGFTPEDILFLSDVEAELLAAQKVGYQVMQSLRPGISTQNLFPTIENFHQIHV